MPGFIVSMHVVVDAPTAGEAIRKAQQGKVRAFLDTPKVRAHNEFCSEELCHLGGTGHTLSECRDPQWWRGIYPPPAIRKTVDGAKRGFCMVESEYLPPKGGDLNKGGPRQ